MGSINEFKRCSNCEAVKPLDQFHKSARYCKVCCAEYYVKNRQRINHQCREWRSKNPTYRLEYYQRNRERIKQYQKQYRIQHGVMPKEKTRSLKNCPCGKGIPKRAKYCSRECTDKANRINAQIAKNCLFCGGLFSGPRCLIHKKKCCSDECRLRLLRKNARLRTHCKRCRVEFEVIRGRKVYCKECFQKRKEESPLKNKIADNLRSRINKVLKGSSKSASTFELLGCSHDQLKLHLESKFKKGMTWKNYGTKWHIDHIEPCASFDLSSPEQQRICFHFTNLQPMRSKENLSKGCRITEVQREFLLKI